MMLHNLLHIFANTAAAFKPLCYALFRLFKIFISIFCFTICFTKSVKCSIIKGT